MSQNEILQGSGKESSVSQLFYLDFNGAETSYFNRDLGISIDNVSVSASGFGAQQAATIVNALNTRFSGEAFFTTIRPDEGEYSTVYIGLTSAFDAYGQFLGIAETVDTGNKIHDDNAFVLLDARATTEQVASVIAHEAGHLLGNVEHGGEGLGRYALETSVANGQVSSGIALQEADYLRVSSGGTAENTTVNECGGVYVYEGGTANSTTINRWGELYVYEGGIANSTTVNEGGWFEVSSGGTAYGGAISSGGTMWVDGGGTVEEIVVSNGGYVKVFEGAEATGLSIEDGGAFEFVVAPETYVQWTSGGFEYEMEGGLLSEYVLSSGTISVLQDGIVEGITVNAGGELWVYDGGMAMQIIENGGFVWTQDGAEASFDTNTFSGVVLENNMATVHAETTALDTTINDQGVMSIFEGGSASGVVVNQGGVLEISSGGIATEVMENGGFVWVNEGASATFVSNAVNNLELGLKEGEEPPSLEVYEEKASLHSGTTATSTTLYDCGWLHICEGGVANDTVVSSGGEICVYEGGIANGITANDACWITLKDGATVSGQIDLNGTSVILVQGDVYAEDAEFNFHFDTQTPEDYYLLCFIDQYWYEFDGIGKLFGGSFAITIGPSLDCGVYKFIAGAMDFDVTFAVMDADSQSIGELDVDGAILAYGGFGYYLASDGENITLNVVDAEETDIVPPVITGIAADVTSATNGAVTVTATASDNSGEVTLYYIKDGGLLTVYEDGVVFTANGSVIFKAVDAAGNETFSDEFVVSNIDNVAPVISGIAADVMEPTKGAVTVTATASDDSGEVSLYYSKDGGDFTAYENGVVFTENGSVVFKAVDAVGNETVSEEFAVTNIDTNAPVISNVAADVTEPTNGAVKVTATASDNSGQVSLYYSKDGGDFMAYENGVAFTENGSIVFKAVDAAGNETVSDAFTVTNIDTVAPVIANVAADVTETTNGTVKVTATASDDSGEVTLYYSKNGGDFTAYQDGVAFSENGKVVFKAVDAAGNETLSEEFLVSNIDSVAPVISDIAADITAPTKG
ncbi:MAG: AIDA repeat-containing protein, partial [Victivallales bacterium]|nr:AIDA repeat-containing protein [Victivallales bacterium]